MENELETFRFRDMLYGSVAIPTRLLPFIRLPEFVRLRGVGLSNVDSYEFKDFGGPTRWEHGIAVCGLALRCARRMKLNLTESTQLALAALLHDAATPPFAHTAEHILPDFDHELETLNLLSERPSVDSWPSTTVFASQTPQFLRRCRALEAELGAPIDVDEIGRMVIGEGELGYLISGVVDLDNADNVTRSCLHLGIPVEPTVPQRLADWLADLDAPPVDLNEVREEFVEQWLEYRSQLYSAFYESSDEELGRQAFLQHLMRRGLAAGLPRRALVWNTEDGLLNAIAALKTGDGERPLNELVGRYRLLESPRHIATVAIEDPEVVRSLKQPQATSWLEDELLDPENGILVLVITRRWNTPKTASLLDPPPGRLELFALSEELIPERLPSWIRERLMGSPRGRELGRAIAEAVRTQFKAWLRERPWMSWKPTAASLPDILDSMGDWGFRVSRNDNFHAYPSTFVHALPAALIQGLGVRGELVLDPFGGTGQTAIEAIKLGGDAVTNDSNAVATLVARARLRFLTVEDRQWLRSLTLSDLREQEGIEPPDYPLRAQWHHPQTLEELSRIAGFIREVENPRKSNFLRACFSAILPGSTARRGKQHGWFADNTPLPRGLPEAPYQNVIEDFIRRIDANVKRVERLYASIERGGREPEEELQRVKITEHDARVAGPPDYGIEARSVAAVLTSPPYLCMTDYTLGSRLSYYWLFPHLFERDYESEIGARRRRFAPETAMARYREDMAAFMDRARELLRPDGYLAIVMNSPSAKAFRDSNILRQIDRLFGVKGFVLVWEKWRPIHWHRNQGYQRLREERVAVFRSAVD